MILSREKNEEIKLSIEGLTDTDGENDYNQQLSEKRAQSVLETLVKMRISEGRLTYKGYGESTPIADNTTAEGKANNSRVEFVKI